MKTHFAFGRNGIDVSLPDGFNYQLIRAAPPRALTNARAAIEAALDNPIACPPLSALAAGKRSAAISVCDITRPAPNSITLPPLLARLHSAGIAKENITIFIATGLHRPATDDEITASSALKSPPPIASSITMRASSASTAPSAPRAAEPPSTSTSASWPPTCTSPSASLSST